MRVLVTGGAGKIGLYVIEELLGDSSVAAVHVLDKVHTAPSDPRVSSFAGDVLDPDDVNRAMIGVDAVVHLAAVHKYGIATDETTLKTNVLGTWTVLEAARRQGVRRFVHTSSSSVVGLDYADHPILPSRLPMDESVELRPQDSYSVSKAASEVVARSFADRAGIDVIVLRPPWVLTPETSAGLRLTSGCRDCPLGTTAYVDVRDLAVAYRLALQSVIHGFHVFFVAAPDSTVGVPIADHLGSIDPRLRELASELAISEGPFRCTAAEHLLGWRAQRSWRAADTSA